MQGQLQPRTTAARLAGVPTLLLVGVGGAAGSLARHGVLLATSAPSGAVFALNVLGSFALGSITAWLQHSDSALHGSHGEARESWAALLGLGFCGGLTTFSTHVVDVARLLDASDLGAAGLSLFGTASIAVVAAGAGYELLHRSLAPTNRGTG